MDHKQFESICKQIKGHKGEIRAADLDSLPEPVCSTLQYVLRIGRISLTDFSKRLDVKPEQARQLADLLVARNLFQLSSFSNPQEIFYETRHTTVTRPLARPLLGSWKKIDDDK